jgi:hypothetical protein
MIPARTDAIEALVMFAILELMATCGCLAFGYWQELHTIVPDAQFAQTFMDECLATGTKYLLVGKRDGRPQGGAVCISLE